MFEHPLCEGNLWARAQSGHVSCLDLYRIAYWDSLATKRLLPGGYASDGHRVVLNHVFPGELTTWLDVYCDIRFDCEYGTNRPQHVPDQRPIACNPHPRAHLRVLNDHLGVRGAIAESLELHYCLVLPRQCLGIDHFISTNIDEVFVGWPGRLDYEGHFDLEIRSGRLLVEHYEIMVVNGAFNDALPGILQTMLDRQFRLSL